MDAIAPAQPTRNLRVVIRLDGATITDELRSRLEEKDFDLRKIESNDSLDELKRLLSPDQLRLEPTARFVFGRLFADVNSALLEEMVKQAVTRAGIVGRNYSPPDNLAHYYRMDIETSMNDSQIETYMDFLKDSGRALDAYIEPQASILPPSGSAVAYTTNPLAEYQDHLESAPRGLDAHYAWQQFPDAANGFGISFIDIEQGWFFGHEDLAGLGSESPLTGVNKEFVDFGGTQIPVQDHGTAMLGLVKAADNSKGCVGLAPACMAWTVSEWHRGAEGYPDWERQDRVVALTDAILHLLKQDEMGAGSVILLEAQAIGSSGVVPLEAEHEALRWLIQTATLCDIIVVEPAGNGGQNVSAYLVPDSGAIVVGAAQPNEAPFEDRRWTRWPRSNFGSGSVHCFARGDQVYSLTSDIVRYKSGTGGTSAAAAIIAGAAAILQAIMKANGKILSPYEMREVLRDPNLGTKIPGGGTSIGVMPDFKKILTLFSTTPVALVPAGPDGILNTTVQGHIPLDANARAAEKQALKVALDASIAQPGIDPGQPQPEKSHALAAIPTPF